MKKLWLMIFTAIFSLGCIDATAQPKGVKSKNKEIATDTLTIQQDTSKVKFIRIVTGDDGVEYMTRSFGYVVVKRSIGKFLMKPQEVFYFTTKWVAIKPEELENVVAFDWQ